MRTPATVRYTFWNLNIILKTLTSEKLSLFCTLSQYFWNYEDIVEGYFGDEAPDVVWVFLQTLLQLLQNVDFIEQRSLAEEQQ